MFCILLVQLVIDVTEMYHEQKPQLPLYAPGSNEILL